MPHGVLSVQDHAVPLGDRFLRGVEFVLHAYACKTRKVTGAPYAAHLLSVAGIVLDEGSDEDLAVAALLHDALEDTEEGSEGVRDRIRALFGERVLAIVEACTDARPEIRRILPWRVRKERYLARLETCESTDVLLVTLADKLDNARSLLANLRRSGESVWTTFSGRRENTLWYYTSLVRVLNGRTSPHLWVDLQGTVERIVELSKRDA